MHVIVIGGGIGGLALANGLKRAGVSVAVYERDATPTNRNQGYRIHINTVGSRALHAVLRPEVWETLVATAGDPGHGMAFFTDQLDRLALIEQELFTGGLTRPEEGHHAVSRITLRQLLLADLDGIVHFGKRFTGYEAGGRVTGYEAGERVTGYEAGERVTAHFEDGTTATGDVLIGADGGNSRVRAQLLPAAKRVESGAIGVGGKLYLTDENRAWLPGRIPAGMNVIFGPPKLAMFTAVFNRRNRDDQVLRELGDKLGIDAETFAGDAADADYVLWAFVGRRDAYPGGADRLDGAGLAELVGRRIAGWHPALARMVAESRPADVELFDFRTAEPVEPWPTSNVTLLGDAIHGMLPTGGEGGNTALQDARLLTERLAAADRGEVELLPALGSYEKDMLQYGFAAVKKSLTNARMGISASRTNRIFARAFFRVCQAVPPLKRAIFAERWSTR